MSEQRSVGGETAATERKAAVIAVFRRFDGELFPDPDTYEQELNVDRESYKGRVFWMPDNDAFESTGLWTSEAIIDGEPVDIVMTMDPDQALEEGAVVCLASPRNGLDVEVSIEEALEIVSAIYPEQPHGYDSDIRT